MSRVETVFLIGLVLAIAGVVLFVSSGSLATHWQEEPSRALGGMTDPDLRFSYRLGGAVLAVAGLVALGMAAWRWLGNAPSRGRHGIG